MKNRAVIIRSVCYLLMLAAVLAWPVRKILHYDFPKIPPQAFVFPVENRNTTDLTKNNHLDLGCWTTTVRSSNTNVPAEVQRIFVTLGKDAQGIVKPQQVYFKSSEIPPSVPFIRADYLFQEQNKILFSFSLGSFYLNESELAELQKKNSRIFAVLKIYSDGTFLVDSLLINGKKF